MKGYVLGVRWLHVVTTREGSIHVVGNIALSADGRLAGSGGRPVGISCEADWKRVHHLRARLDAILVGVDTVRSDDPSLRVKAKYAEGPDPVPVIVDPRGECPLDARAMREGTLWFTVRVPDRIPPGVVHVSFPNRGDGRAAWRAMWAELARRGLRSVLVEGGNKIHLDLIESGAWDQFTIYRCPNALGEGPIWEGFEALQGLAIEHPLGKGLLSTFLNSRA